MAGGWRRPENKELRNLYTSSNIIYPIRPRKMGLARHISRMGDMRNVYKVLVRKPEQKRPLGRHRRKWENNISKELREIVWEVVNWMQLTQDRVLYSPP
jgi:hypothetical protein